MQNAPMLYFQMWKSTKCMYDFKLAPNECKWANIYIFSYVHPQICKTLINEVF